MRQLEKFDPPRYPGDPSDEDLLAKWRAERGAKEGVVEQIVRPRYPGEPSDKALLETWSDERRAATKEIKANPLTSETVMTPKQRALGLLAVSGVELPPVPEIPMQQVRETAADQAQKAEQIPARVA